MDRSVNSDSALDSCVRFINLGEMMNLGGLDGSVTTLGGRIKLSGKAAGLARRAVYAVSHHRNAACVVSVGAKCDKDVV